MVRQNIIEQPCECSCPPIPPCPPTPTPVVSVRSVNGKIGDVVLDSLKIGDKLYNGSAAIELLPADLDLEKAFVYRKSVTTIEKAIAYMELTEKVGDVCYCTEDKKFYMSTGEGAYLTWSSVGNEQEQADWSETDSSKVSFIKNKPDLTIYALKNQSGNKITVTIPTGTRDVVTKLLDYNDNLLSEATITLPQDEFVIHGEYDKTRKVIVLTLNTGAKIEIPIGDLLENVATKDELAQEVSDLKDWVEAKNYVVSIAGKSLSTNDYDDNAKAKVDAIPPNPKYTDTVYDDTEVRNDIANLQEIKADKATTISGYGITDAKIIGNTITLGSNSITPLTEHQSLLEYRKSAAQDVIDNSKANKSEFDSHVNNTSIHVTLEDKNTWSAKQDKISDLENIRIGATLGATSVQPSEISNMATKSWVTAQGYLTEHQSLSAYRTKSEQDVIDAAKQDNLVSGTNIKTINNISILGSGNVEIAAPKLSSSLTANVTVGGITAGDEFEAGTSLEYILRKLLVRDTVAIAFDANGGTGSMATVYVIKGESYTLPANAFTAPENKEFDCWLIDETEYQPGVAITVTSDITVLAKWKEGTTVIYYGCTSDEQPMPTDVSDLTPITTAKTTVKSSGVTLNFSADQGSYLSCAVEKSLGTPKITQGGIFDITDLLNKSEILVGGKEYLLFTHPDAQGPTVSMSWKIEY